MAVSGLRKGRIPGRRLHNFRAHNTSESLSEVKVEKTVDGFCVRVTSRKGRSLLVPILEAFEKLHLDVLQATVSNYTRSFSMEASVRAPNQALDVREVTSSLLMAIKDLS